ncbi:hypothetical protein KVR01_004008 [Diaporthe batatas]|uniref:uncharacterized protein n=1 Tax=Diaporthe batatas TaxID=748121 RepID=UPI001D04BF2D|nr:uncharacterized protein KVR01_004008 [Diaporthe batatas]KAG8165456.1 hypothetical protein KVR01_004008 [Diaporthe batatas]
MDASSSLGGDDDWEIVSTSSRPRSPSPTREASRSEAAPVQAPVAAHTPLSTVHLSYNMPGWKEDYLSSILEAEKNSPVNHELVEACSLLNDRIAALEAEKAHWQSATSSASSAQQSTAKEPPTATPDPTQSRLRADLAEALRQKSSLEARLRKTTSERDALQTTQRSQARAIRDLSGERDALRLRVGDQAEELRVKKHMMQQMQDEVLALEMQLNVAEAQKAKIAAENKQLIERWMRRARQEADDMNAANEKRGDGP